MNSSRRLPDGLVIPDHHLERCIGEGGYGEIWLARNVIGTYRAVKIVFRSSFGDPGPFEREFNGLKTFEPISRNHPGFVDILQVGRNDEAGYIYYVMELADDEVSGRIVDPDSYSAKSLARERDKRGRLPADECLRIGLSLAATLAHLHKHGLVHRDIKPSNIIFINGEPKLADIGLVISLSEAKTFVGSDGYIPPEGQGTCQADIYSFGKLLYEISTGQDKNQFPELPREVATFDDAATLLELNEVMLKAGENDKRQRYKTADEVHADLTMISSGRSVKQLRFIERQLTRVRRVAGAAIALAVLAAAFAVVVFNLRQQERAALAKAHVTTGMKWVEEGNVGAAVPSFTEALRLQQHNDVAAEAHRLRIGSALDRTPRLLQFWEFAATVHALQFSRDGTKVLAAGRKMVRLYDIESGEIRREFTLKHGVLGASFSPDGTRMAVANGGFVTVFDPATGDEIFEVRKRGLIISAEFSPDAEIIVAGSEASTAFLIDASTGATIAELKGHRSEVGSASFSPDGKFIVTASRDGSGGLWNAKTHELIAFLPHAQWVLHATFSPDGQYVATASTDHTAFIWKVSAQPHISARMEHRGGVQRLAFSPDGHWLVTASLDHTARFWEAKNGRPGLSVVNMLSPGLLADYSPDGNLIVTAEQSGRINVWRISATPPLDVGPGIVSANGERYITIASNSFRVWNARNDAPLTPQLTFSNALASVTSDANGRTLAACVVSEDEPATVHLHDTDKKATRSFQLSSVRKSVLLSPDGTKFLATNDTAVVLHDAATGKVIFERTDFPRRVELAVFSPDGRAIALRIRQDVFVLDAATGTNLLGPITNSMGVSSLSFTHDSSRLAISTKNSSFIPGASSIWDLGTKQRITEFTQHMDGVMTTVFTRDGRTAATSGEDSFVFIWKVESGEALVEALPLFAKVRSVKFSQDDRWLSACSWRDAQLWDRETGRALTPGFLFPGRGRFEDCGIVADKSRIWVQGTYNLYFWNLPQAHGTPDELLAFARHLGIAIPIGISWDPQAFPLEKLRTHCAEERKRARAELSAWHAQQARRFEKLPDLNWFAARFHLEQLVKRNPEDSALRIRLAAAAKQLEQELNSTRVTPDVQPTP